MSQSDYLKYKRVSTQLKIDNNTSKQPRVFNSQDLLNYKQYSLENTITTNNININRITPAGYIHVFGMDKKTTNCPQFKVCRQTNQRTNRVAMSNVYFDPTPQPLTIDQRNKATNLKNSNIKCTCALYKKKTGDNTCSCKISF